MNPSPNLSAYKKALRVHLEYNYAVQEAQRAAEQAILRQKRSYWESLNAYEFERATADVLRFHHFTAKVTQGSSDGGVDIEVERAGRKGVIQCKARAKAVGPHTVRDLYGAMHASDADFGMIVSLTGFTKGAIDFTRDKPLFLIDVDDLIAMQQGVDILADAFRV